MKDINLLKNSQDLDDQKDTPIHTTPPDGVFYSNSRDSGKIIKINSNKYKIIESGAYTGLIICGLVLYSIIIFIFFLRVGRFVSGFLLCAFAKNLSCFASIVFII